MRVVHIVPAITKEASGPSYSVVRLCESLIAQKQEVTLAALDLETIPSPPCFLKTFPIGWGPRQLGRSPSMHHWLEKQLQSNTVDILHNHGMWQMNAIYPGSVAKKFNRNLVVSPRGAFSEWAMQYGSVTKKAFWPLLQQPAIANASCFHATAISEYEDIRRLGFRQPVAIIPNGIDIPDIIHKVQQDFRTLLFLGRIHPVKGLDMLLPAWKTVQNHFPNWQLVIAGSDIGYYGKSDYLQEMQSLAQKLGLERIKFIGELRGIEKMQAYQNSELFILPSYSENFGVTVAEALATGTPAIVTKGAPWNGLVAQQAGWWIDINLDALVATLEDALNRTPEYLEQMGMRGRTWMTDEFSWERIGSQMVNTYQWLLDKSLPVPAWVQIE